MKVSHTQKNAKNAWFSYSASHIIQSIQYLTHLQALLWDCRVHIETFTKH